MNIKNIKEPWGENIESEHSALKEKYTHLIDYINSEEFYKLSFNTRKLIVNLKVLMEAYINNLSTMLYESIDDIFVLDFSLFGSILNMPPVSLNLPFNNTITNKTSEKTLDKVVTE